MFSQQTELALQELPAVPTAVTGVHVRPTRPVRLEASIPSREKRVASDGELDCRTIAVSTSTQDDSVREAAHILGGIAALDRTSVAATGIALDVGGCGDRKKRHSESDEGGDVAEHIGWCC